MKNFMMFLVMLPMVIFNLAGASHGWDGRMGGMGDPVGLVQDESDFLINPAGVAHGQGVRYYGGFRYTYTGVSDWDFNLDALTTSGNPMGSYHFDTSGHENRYDALLGAAFPLGRGRMGLFLTYAGVAGGYDGHESITFMSDFAAHHLDNDLDNVALRLIYGVTAQEMDAGIEIGMAYRDENRKALWNQTDMTVSSQNYFWSFNVPERSLLPFTIPYDSRFWELNWKTGFLKRYGALDVSASLRGGAIVASDNDYQYLFQMPKGANTYNSDSKGGVSGWRIGSDLWLRYAVKDGLTLPFLVSVDYAEKKRDGNGIGTGTFDNGTAYYYTHKEQALDLKVGGGIERKIGGKALLAAGLYYNYLQGGDDFRITRSDSGTSDNSDFPFQQEHRVIARLAGELALSPAVTLRMGISPFYGWVSEDFAYQNYITPDFVFVKDKISSDGHHWGIGASFGGSVKLRSITVEPFVKGGWQQLHLSGDGEQTNNVGTTLSLWKMEKTREEWFIGMGVSLLFGR